MTPDEYRRKYKSWDTCEYNEIRIVIGDLHTRCLVKNRDIAVKECKRCKCYKPIPFHEKQESEE